MNSTGFENTCWPVNTGLPCITRSYWKVLLSCSVVYVSTGGAEEMDNESFLRQLTAMQAWFTFTPSLLLLWWCFTIQSASGYSKGICTEVIWTSNKSKKYFNAFFCCLALHLFQNLNWRKPLLSLCLLFIFLYISWVLCVLVTDQVHIPED